MFKSLTALIKRKRIIEYKGKFYSQIYCFLKDTGRDGRAIGWLTIDRNNHRLFYETVNHSNVEDYCGNRSFDEAVSIFDKYFDEVERRKNANKKIVHIVPPSEPKAWRVLKSKKAD